MGRSDTSTIRLPTAKASNPWPGRMPSFSRTSLGITSRYLRDAVTLDVVRTLLTLDAFDFPPNPGARHELAEDIVMRPHARSPPCACPRPIHRTRACRRGAPAGAERLPHPPSPQDVVDARGDVLAHLVPTHARRQQRVVVRLVVANMGGDGKADRLGGERLRRGARPRARGGGPERRRRRGTRPRPGRARRPRPAGPGARSACGRGSTAARRRRASSAPASAG